METGRLICFGDILSEQGSISSGGPMMIDRFEHAGIEYFVDDLYCPSPDCDCHAVHLRFLRCSPTQDGGVFAQDWFEATLALEDRLKSIVCAGGTRAEAKAIFQTWRKTTAVGLDELAWRYWKVKDIAERSLATADKAPRKKLFPPETEAAPKRLSRGAESGAGRNEPCPCGSGKKFKKCCGKR